MQTLFFRLLDQDNKDTALAGAIGQLAEGRETEAVHVVDPDSFRQVPGSPFGYWVSDSIRRPFSELSPFEVEGRELRVGGQTSDDFRFLRLYWEVSASSDRSWIPYQKGGDYSRFYSDIHLVADWDKERKTYRGFFGRIGRMNEHPSSYQYFFKPGLTWSRQSQLGLSLRALPKGCIFADKGPCMFASDAFQPSLLGLSNSQVFHVLVLLQMAFGSYEVGVLQRTPVPDLNNPQGGRLGNVAFAFLELKRDLDRTNETSHVFHLPALLRVPGTTLADRIVSWNSRVAETERHLADHQREIDDIAFRLYGIEGEDRRAIEAASRSPLAASTGEEDNEEDDV